MTGPRPVGGTGGTGDIGGSGGSGGSGGIGGIGGGIGDVGDIGEEARALVEAARDWVVRTVPESHSAECRWCPVCRTVAALRDPVVPERIAGAVGAAAGTLAALLDALTRPGSGEPAQPEPASPVQHIPLDEDP